MKERSLRDAIQQFKSGIKKSDFIKVKGNKDYLSVPYRVNFVRGYFGDRLQILTESTELSSGSFKFVSSIILDGKCISNGESKQMHTKEKDFEKSQSVSIGRGLSFAGFMGSEVATVEEMQEFIRTDETFDDKKIVKDKTFESGHKVNFPKDEIIAPVDVTKLANDWIAKLKEIAKDESSPHKFEKNYQIQVKQFESELKQIRLDPIEDLRVETEYAKLKSQIQNNQGKNNGRL
ncbi:hypothetical protein N9S53_00275 [Candidatus Pelagibacter sp.]|nr:hypothetical protein [Candidatus Pelagibacter sp.]